jgi:hypothetical protein
MESVENCTGFVNIVPETGAYSIYPNPSAGIIYVESTIKKPSEYSLHNITGRCITIGSFCDQAQIHVPDPGVYVIRIRNTDQQIIRKIIIE